MEEYNMQALILAAGFGKRLLPITKSLPKCLVKVNGIPLLENALGNLSYFSFNEVIIVVGHMKEKIIEYIGHEYKGMRITYVENPLYKSTNNVYSLYLSKDYIHDNLLMLECDLFYKKDLIETILAGDAECNILVSPFDKNTMEGTVIEVGENRIAKALYTARHQFPGFDYTGMMKTVNVYKFSQGFMQDKFIPSLENYIKTQSVQSYYELVLGSLIYYGNDDIKVVNIDKSKWCEIDDIEDLKRAERMFAFD
jgi:choline kinase